MPRITKRTVDELRPAAGDVMLWDQGDGALKGFGVRMKPSGVAAYVVQYRNSEGSSRRLTLGRVGTLTPDQARALARDKLMEVSKGGDPAAARRAARAATTVSETCDQYLADAAAGRILGRKGKPIKSSTLAMDRSRIERHVKPLIGRRAVAGLTVSDIEKLLNDIAAGRTAKARPKAGRTGETRGGRGVAARTVRMLAAIFAHARITPNPARGVKLFADGQRDRALSLAEIERLGAAMRAADEEGKSRTGIAAVRALALTGCRKAEVLSLTWDQMDASAQCIRFADTKSGAQIRPLGKAALDHLLSQSRRGAFVFPADRGDGHFIGIAGVLDELCARASLADVSPHVLRHTFASVAAALNHSELTIAALLGHAARGVTGRYVHLAPDPALLAAGSTTAARIAAALDGREPAAVLPIRRRRVS